MANSILNPALIPKQESEEKPLQQAARAGIAATCGPEDWHQEAHQGAGLVERRQTGETGLQIAVSWENLADPFSIGLGVGMVLL